MSKKIIHFTQARIKNLPIPEKGRTEYYDEGKSKLMCRVTSAGHKSFGVVKWGDGKTQRVTIGSTNDVTVDYARKQTDKILASISSGVNPTESKRKSSKGKTPLGTALDMYLTDRDLKPTTIKDYRYKLTLGFKDWLKKPVGSITEDMVEARHKKISKTGKTTASTTMRVLRLTLNYAAAVGMIESNPTKILSRARLWHKNNPKDRVIPSNKLQDWHKAVEALTNERAKAYLLMTLYMGFRSVEALTLEWSHVDLKNNTITIYNTKNGSDHRLPIPTALLPHIKKLKDNTGTHKWVFASTLKINGEITGRPMAVPTKQIKAITRACGVEFSSHDCRRTFATIAEAVNLPLTMIKRLMNHSTTNDVTGGYIVTEEATLREAINKVASYIQARTTQKDNVIRLHG